MSITSIESIHLRRAGSYVDECIDHADIHTVTLELNGQHGGIDVKIEGLTVPDDDMNYEDYERVFRLG